MTQTILFDPLVPWPVIWAAGGVTLAALLLGLWKGLSGWALRALAALVLLAALSGPVHQSEDRAALSDIVIVAEDQTASQQLRDRPEQMARARTQLKAALAGRPGTDVRWVTVPDGEATRARG